MKRNKIYGMMIAGGCAGFINGLFGAGGGMILVPLLGLLTDLEERQIFNISIAIILPICLLSLAATALTSPIPLNDALPYLFGSAAGGYLAAKYGDKVPALWLHRGLGVLILWGGIRYLC